MEHVEQYAKNKAIQVIAGDLSSLPIMLTDSGESGKIFKEKFLYVLQQEIYKVQNEIYLIIHNSGKTTDLGNLNFQLMYLRTVQKIFEGIK